MSEEDRYPDCRCGPHLAGTVQPLRYKKAFPPAPDATLIRTIAPRPFPWDC
jgi:hypothetical protein